MNQQQQQQQALNNPKLRKIRVSNTNGFQQTQTQTQRQRKSSSDHTSDSHRPLKRASSISYRVNTPTSYIINDNERSSSFSSLSPSTKNMILNRKKSSNNLAGKLKTKFIKPMFRSKSSLSINDESGGSYSPPLSPRLRHQDSFESINSQFDDSFDEDDDDSDYLRSPVTPQSPELINQFNDNQFKKNLLIDLLNCNEDDLESPTTTTTTTIKKTSPIFEIPEILNIILRYVGHDDYKRIPIESAPIRRPPMSYNHAVLIHDGNKQQADQVWSRAVSNSSEHKPKEKHSSNLYNCLLVNKLWYRLTLEKLQENIFFESDEKLSKYNNNENYSQRIKPNSIVMHKLKKTTQFQIDSIFNKSSINTINLKWLEFYICPNLLPSFNLFSINLEKLIIPGSKLLDDSNISKIVQLSPNLKHIDIRACELITDAGIYSIGDNCQKLESFNCGRHLKGQLISDISIAKVIQNNLNLKTLGLAGCGITDKIIWEIAVILGDDLERLSLNNCWKLGNSGLNLTLKNNYFKKLSVLEIRNCVNITEMESFVKFKKNQLQKGILILIETCELLEKRLKDFQINHDLEITSRIYRDVEDWLDDSLVDAVDDDNYNRFLRSRNVIAS